ncbi:hypothetical protein FEM48_ZijujUnG0078800 [Ziziphus jujuba var. spinosa]|uniref:Transposase (putative) gypsy type domain-containing protein n=1 Tax=Ziziphus jujuba var. spinosa TaxID=714518 RepID=A0A978U8P7_ZIZJJ|nr:hypothetical protein FEM48_ZijujUnG0078800 [Ziziphus jujuba var. spinosa]
MDKRKFNLQTFLEQNRNKIPKSVKVDIASSIDQEIEGGIVIHASTFDLGLYLPFHSLIREILSKLGLAPIQLSQNCWRIMFGIIALNQILEINLGWNEFCHCYAVKQNAAGTYYFSHREATTLLVTDLPKAEKGRKDNLISLTGDWERLPGDTVAHWVPRIKAAPTHKSTGLKPRDSDVNHLDLNKALSLPNEERNWKQLRDHLHRENPSEMMTDIYPRHQLIRQQKRIHPHSATPIVANVFFTMAIIFIKFQKEVQGIVHRLSNEVKELKAIIARKDEEIEELRSVKKKEPVTAGIPGATNTEKPYKAHEETKENPMFKFTEHLKKDILTNFFKNFLPWQNYKKLNNLNLGENF